MKKEFLIAGLWIATGIVLLITTIQTERLQKRVGFLEEQWIAHDSAGRLGTDSFWSGWQKKMHDTLHSYITDESDGGVWHESPLLIADSDLILGGVIESNTTIDNDAMTWKTAGGSGTVHDPKAPASWPIGGTITSARWEKPKDTLPPTEMYNLPYRGDEGIDPQEYRIDTIIRWTPYPTPRKDTVDWKKVFEKWKPDSPPLVGEFYYFMGGVVKDTKWYEYINIDSSGKLNVKDSLLAIQELIKQWVQQNNELYKNERNKKP